MAKTFSALLVLFLISSTAYAAPLLYVDKPQYEFGTISQEDKAEHLFEIENRGDSDLIIEKLAPS